MRTSSVPISFALAAALANGCSGTSGDVAAPTPAPADAATASSAAPAPPAPPPPASDAGAPAACADRSDLKNVYWGDLHVHTSYSLDSYTFGNRNDPKDAYAFARGAAVTISAGTGGTQTQTIKRPLDFAAVTDHSEWLAVTGECLLDASGGRPYCTGYRNQGSAAQKAVRVAAMGQAALPEPQGMPWCKDGDAATCAAAARTAWQKLRLAASTAYEPCKFTSLVGYEWTATTGGRNLHRNVIFGTESVPDDVYDYVRYPTPLELWKALESGCKAGAGCDVLTVPHNSNLSRGTMWETADDPSARPYMTRYQTLVEIFQHKGSSECMTGTPLGDPSCSFEDLNADTDATVAQGMVRDGLGLGLEMRARGVDNPLVLGIVGATDTHNGNPGATAEDEWRGHGGDGEDTPEDRLSNGRFNPGGMTAVWAEDNTRASVFAALKRRETYATSGPRMNVRFYAVPNVADDAAASALCADPELPKKIVGASGVPMGGSLRSTGAPYFFVSAMKDAVPLQEVDVIKLSTDAAGKATVTVQRISLTGAQQSAACVFWRDPAYDGTKPSVYYARVFEEPSWRWSHYDCAALGAAAPAGCQAGGGLDTKVRERAWTSPVFVER